MNGAEHVLQVWGDLACFTRPELKVERFSYPVMTPSAARGIFDAIYCKPNEFRWQVTRIEVLKPPAFIALRRNEVKEKVSVNAVLKYMKKGTPPEPIWADGDRDLTRSDEKGRTQRQTMALRDVAYRVHARIRPWPGFEKRQAAFDAQFRRRAGRGKCFFQPYLGCREFPAYFTLLEAPPPVENDVTIEIGLMLYDVFDLSRPGRPEDPPAISLFRATVRNGVLHVPEYESPDVLKSERR